MASTRRTAPVLAVAACGAALALSACGSSGGTTGAPTDPTADGSVSVPASTPFQTSPGDDARSDPAPSPSGTGGDDTASGPCAADALKVTVTQGDAAAGSIGYKVTFTNTSQGACTLDGHPGVSAVGEGHGTRIGASATRTEEATSSVLLKPGQDAAATLTAVNIGSLGGPLGGQCAPVDADGWRIYPPDSKESVFVAQDGLKACSQDDADWLTISVVHPAA